MSKQKMPEEVASLFNRNDPKEIKQYINQIKASSDTLSFSTFIDQHKPSSVTREEIAKRLGYVEKERLAKKTEIIKKTINTTGYTTNRDRIIAICIAIELSVDDTNTALKLYGMLPLDENQPRDRVIIAGIYEYRDYFTINNWLEIAELGPLQIEKTKKIDPSYILLTPKDKLSNYEILDEHIECYSLTGDNSISGKYHPQSHYFRADATLKRNDGKKLTLVAEDRQILSINDKNQLMSHPKDTDIISIESPNHFHADYRTIQDVSKTDSELLKYYVDLKTKLRQKISDTFNMWNDTRNYMYRYDANFKNGKMEYYIETFNYEYPERNEYFQMCLSNNVCSMTVTNSSVFLYYYLGEFYSNFYELSPNIESIEKYYSTTDISNSSNRQVIIKNRIDIFKRLKDQLEFFKTQLRSREQIIVNPNIHFYDWKDITDYYNIAHLFEWDCSIPLFLPKTKQVSYVTRKGDTFKISLELLKRSYELGIFDIENICDILREYGDIESILQ